MSNEIQLFDQQVFQATPTGLVIVQAPTFEQFDIAYQVATQCSRALPWVIGDLLNYGEAAYGERYAQVMDDTGASYKTLQNYKWITSKVCPAQRRADLSFTHHTEVAKMEPELQAKWLEVAVAKKWTTKELSKEIKKPQTSGQPDISERKQTTCANSEPDSPPKQKSTYDEPEPGKPVDIRPEKDEAGNVLPESMRDAFAQRQDFRELLSDISRIKSRVTQAKQDDEPILWELSLSSFQAMCDNIRRSLKNALPHAICPYCGGDGCEACKTRGYVGRGIYQAAPAEMKAIK